MGLARYHQIRQQSQRLAAVYLNSRVVQFNEWGAEQTQG
jgi:hypothetical protein